MFLRYLIFLSANFFLMFRKALEYKSNFYSSIISESIYLASIITFFSLLYYNFNEVIIWNLNDFYFYYGIYSVVFLASGIFFFKYRLFEVVRDGIMNLYLIRPISPPLFYFLSELSAIAFIMFNMYLVYLVFVIYYLDIVLNNVFFGGVIVLLIILLNFLFYFFIYSLDICFMGINKVLAQNVSYLRRNTQSYPAPFFNNLYLRSFLFIFSPIFFVSSLLIPILRNYEVYYFKFQIIFLIGLIIFFILGIKFLWKTGLERYSGYN